MAVMSVLFSASEANADMSEDKVAIIDYFFTSMVLTEADSNKWPAEEILLGQLMAKLDTENRWVYTAKEIMPPCKKTTYYSVLSTIYPIKEEHLGLLKAQIARMVKSSQTGNYRISNQQDGINNL
jgi:hypothetical protein